MPKLTFEHFVLLLKAWCVTTSAGSSAFAAGLKMLELPTIFGLPTKLVELMFEVYATMAVTLVGFMSSSFTDFMTQRRNGNGNGNGHAPPSTPADPTVKP